MNDGQPAGTPALSPAVQVTVLALGGALAHGLGRFAYALILPDMRADLAWSYSQAGWMNGVNAAGYLAGALVTAWVSARIGQRATFTAGILVTALAILATGLTRDFLLLNLFRLAAGVGGAFIFVIGGSMAAEVSVRAGPRSAFALSMFYTGPGIGIVATGAFLPFYAAAHGPAGWQGAWLLLGVLGLFTGAASLFAMPRESAPQRRKGGGTGTFRIAASLPILVAYGVFGAGFIGYMTFMFTLLKQLGAAPAELAAFWVLLGAAGIASPWLWSTLIGGQPHGRALALLMVVAVAGAVIPLVFPTILAACLSGMVFGSAVISAVASTTAFVRRNAHISDWTHGIGVFTIFFGIGQTVGPVLVGFLSDRSGELSAGLWYGAALLGLGAVLALLQSDYLGGEGR